MKKTMMLTGIMAIVGVMSNQTAEAAVKDVKFTETTYGACAREMSVEVKDGKIESFSAVRGCNGNLTALGKLLKGQKVEDVVAMMDDNHCSGAVLTGYTSCMDNLAEMLKQYSMGTGEGAAAAVRPYQKAGEKITEIKANAAKPATVASTGHVCSGCGFCSASAKSV